METFPKLIPADTMRQNNPSQQLTNQSSNRNTVTRSGICSKLTIKRPERRHLYF